MQIYELTSGKRNLKEYDPSRPPPGKPNYATGVGPGVQPQMTATPRMKTAPQPGPAPRLPAPATGAVTPVASAPELPNSHRHGHGVKMQENLFQSLRMR